MKAISAQPLQDPDPKHTEMELKFRANSVHVEDFLGWGIQFSPKRYLQVGCPDIYYEGAGGAVVRHRWGDLDGPLTAPGQLTSKRRKANGDIIDRAEVDLDFGDGVTHDDVRAFLKLAGFSVVLQLEKTSHIFDIAFKSTIGTAHLSVALYSVQPIVTKPRIKVPARKQFLEVEVEKTSGVAPAEAEKILFEFRQQLFKRFGELEREKLSLYELYTGKKYPTVKQ